MRLLFDENFNNDILRGLLLRNPDLDIIRVQDVGLSGVDDRDILEWAASQGRILFTHDVQTMVDFAYERVAAGKPMPGVFEVKRGLAVGPIIDEILLLVECSLPNEWENQVRYLPLR
jgi:predicted nuclease of predicted toxin-antitoxin system